MRYQRDRVRQGARPDRPAELDGREEEPTLERPAATGRTVVDLTTYYRTCAAVLVGLMPDGIVAVFRVTHRDGGASDQSCREGSGWISPVFMPPRAENWSTVPTFLDCAAGP